ncbi:hypothetical protein JX266_007367 [Neoarthrinium moseri]|nr:hypothetical protein JX266_007367 [Neoarthrinium moseri]
MGNPEEAAAAAAAHQPHEDDPPPPYTEDDGKAPPLPPRDTKNNPFLAAQRGPRASSSKEPPQLVNLPRKFPPAFGMYYQKAVRIPTFNLGAEEDQPAFAVTFHTVGHSSSPQLVLHSTADPGSAPLAIAERTGRLGHRSVVTLPAPPGPGSEAESVTEEVHAHVSITSVAYGFSVEVGEGASARREKFEWRSSKGSEVKSLGSGKGSPGRKLVRLSTEADGVGGTRAVRDQGSSSDGREVVAAWADNPKWSGNKAGGFQFLGSGATGELGDRFSVMAVATALRIWEMINESSLQSAATGGSVEPGAG